VRNRQVVILRLAHVEPTFADAILDRIVCNTYRLELDGPS
jgi:hypothetical protein